MSWSKEAARNAVGIIHELVERGQADPIVSVDDVAGRIERTFHDRQTWNQTVMETELSGEVKMFLLVPEP
jgi:hypothetical protein